MKPNEEGIWFGESPDIYHSDAVYETPSLSSSLAKLLITETPRHAFWQSRRLNPKWRDTHKAAWDRGSAAHAIILNSGDRDKITVIKADDWRTKEAKELRDSARAEGLIPILQKDRDDLFEMADCVAEQLDALEGGNPLAVGSPEVTIRWKEELLTGDGQVVTVWCRGRLDFYNSESENLIDLKTSAGSMNPAHWARFTAWSIGAPTQAAFYKAGIRRLTQLGLLRQHDADFLFLLAQSAAPYCLGLVNFPPDIRQRFGEQSADEKLTTAMLKWAECLQTGVWPGYDTSVYVAEGARPIVTRAPAPEQEPMKTDDPRYHVESHDAARGLAPAVDVNDDRDTSWAKGLVGKR